MFFYPGLVLPVLVTVLKVAADSLRDYLDPKLRRPGVVPETDRLRSNTAQHRIVEENTLRH